MPKFPGVSFLSFASRKGRTWEHGPGTLCKLLSSRSSSERLECSEKAFRKRRFMPKFLGVFLFCSGDKKERTWEHKVRTTSNSFSETPFPNIRNRAHTKGATARFLEGFLEGSLKQVPS